MKNLVRAILMNVMETEIFPFRFFISLEYT